MTQLTTHIGRTARRLAILAVPLLVATTGTAAAYGGGMMGGGWGFSGGTMGLWGLLWMGPLLAIPLYFVFVLAGRRENGTGERSLSVLRDRYARGELSDEEFERRRKQLERAG